VYDDFWLDEIWSWRIAANLVTPWQVFTHPSALYDNNHPLNTMLMWAQGVHPGWRLYRGPNLLAGLASVVVAVVILRRRGALAALVGTLLVGFSYPLVLFSSEARGYALVVLFALVAFDALERYLTSRGWFWNLVYVLACVLGLLSHLTFVYFLAAAAAWSGARFVRERRGAGFIAWQLLRLHLLPAACLAFLYVVFVRRLTIGGAPSEALFDALRNALGDLLGADNAPNAAVVLILVALALLALNVFALARRRDDLSVFLVAVVVTPVVVVTLQIALVERRQPIMARYFLVPFVFVLIGWSILLSDWLRTRDARRVASAALIVGFLALNLYHTVLFLRIGRGHYHDAVTYMATYPPGRTPPPLIVVSSDHPLRTGMVLHFYSAFVPPQQRMIIYDDSNLPRLAPRTHGPPMWVMIHSPERGKPPAQAFDQYVFEREFPYYGLSGYSWYLYRHRGLGGSVNAQASITNKAPMTKSQ
jgi:hypothetical protein